MEKYGFVYIWYDRKRKMYYVGSHWGSENDGYICSSNRMRDAYRRRPDDFKRKIISKVYSNRQDLLSIEYKWLSLVEDKELGKKYYNLTKHQNGHWSSSENNFLVSKKISIKLKGRKLSEEHKKNIGNGGIGRIPWNKGIKGIFQHSKETKRKCGLTRLGKINSEKSKEKNRNTHLNKKPSIETKIKMSIAQKNRWNLRKNINDNQ